MTDTTHFEVLIIGAGLSGIGAACHLVREDATTNFAILERREAIGGTWDLFTYPGVRSDSDMLTFGYGFRPWVGTKVLADGPSIKSYVEQTAAEFGVTDRIRFGRRVTKFSWSSQDDLWTVEATAADQREVYTCRFLVGATGYYNYDQGFRPKFPGEESFGGQIVHPQFWPADLDHTGKNVVIIGSGATAITLVPSMAKDAAHVTMLQRSPSYVMPVPETDPVASPLARIGVPARLIHRFGHRRNVLLQQGLYKFCRANPRLARRVLLGVARRQLRGKVDMAHFTPSYNPWDERLCVVPNGDLFKTLRDGEASIVTDHIETFTETGIRTKSGEEIPADLVVSATGLQIQLAGGASIEVDGEPVVVQDRLLYKGVLMEGVPNAMFVVGYTNASWTLKADLASAYLCRLLKHMASQGHTRVVPTATDAPHDEASILGDSMRSGYIQRGNSVMPRQGKAAPWRIFNDYYKDTPMLLRQSITDDALQFSTTSSATTSTATTNASVSDESVAV
ncbi:flavin-containing monooxygenase [Knoellia sp. CPCC 206453]|uniref:flavin-containing monooxygenase n=1 Tax=Knoellia pratensis TaxID=3404796 RepID=UPI0036162D9D